MSTIVSPATNLAQYAQEMALRARDASRELAVVRGERKIGWLRCARTGS
jgi:hypothetical protein